MMHIPCYLFTDGYNNQNVLAAFNLKLKAGSNLGYTFSGIYVTTPFLSNNRSHAQYKFLGLWYIILSIVFPSGE